MTGNELAYIDEVSRTIKEYLTKKWGNPDTENININLWWSKGEAPTMEFETRSGDKIRVKI